MSGRYCLYAAAMALCISQVASAQDQVGADFFTGPDNHLVNFDTDPDGNPIASGTLLQNVYASAGIQFEPNDLAVAWDHYGNSSPNQATGSPDNLQSLNVYFDRPVDAVGAWGYDFMLRTYDANGNLIMQVQYTDGRPCPVPFNFREQRFLGISSPVPIRQAQFLRFYQDQVDCGYRIDDLQFIQQYECLCPMPPLTGNLQISWNNCNGLLGSTPYAFFDCDPASGSVYSLISTLQVLSPFNDLIALDASFDIVLDGQSAMPPFWHFESGGCNELGLGISDDEPSSCTSYLTPWGSGGSLSDAFITVYAPGFSFPNYGRLLLSIARSFDDPIDLAPAPTRYYGWTLSFSMDNGSTCAGCGDAASIRVNGLMLYDQLSLAGRQLNASGPGSQPCASINGGGTSCNPTATRTKTWGQLKSMYR